MITMTIFKGHGLPDSSTHETMAEAKAHWMELSLERRRLYKACLRESGRTVASSPKGKTLISKWSE